MEELTVLAEIEYSKNFLTPTEYQPGVWRYCLYATGDLLPFMDDTYNHTTVRANNVIIDHAEYTEFQTVNDMAERLNNDTGGWVNGGNIVYVRFPFSNPPNVHYSFRYGVLRGFTDNRPVILDGTAYRPGLLSSSRIEMSADALTYNRMKFKTASVTIDNSNGQFDGFDGSGCLFGNEFNVLAGIIPEDENGNQQRKVKLLAEAEKKQLVAVKKTDEYITLTGEGKEKPKPEIWKLATYYIENITAGLETATFHLKDKRERLSGKIPNQQYTVEAYPRIDEKYIGKDMQEAYGYCLGVPGVCLEGTAIYKNGNSGSEMEQYRFRFSSQISRIDRIQVKFNNGKIPDENGGMIEIDGWTTVYDNTQGGRIPWKLGIIPGSLEEMARGIISLSYAVAKQDGDHEKNINEVRMDGVFNNPGGRILNSVLLPGGEFVTPLDIIKDIMNKYAYVPYDKQRYYFISEDESEIEKELAPLNRYEIGVLFDKSVLVYEAIEKLQSGSVFGFQFGVYQNLFTARLDNPNRPIRSDREIRNMEILHLDKVEIDWNADLYGSYTDIEYAYNYDEKAGKRWIDDTKRWAILDIHRQEKDWKAKTLLANEDDAQKKSDVLLEDFTTLQPMIKNIQLSGKKWFDLRVYDMVEIDFKIPGEEREKYPHHLIKLIAEVGEGRLVTMGNETNEYVTLINNKKETAGERYFAGKLRCQILRVQIDTRTGVTTIDVRVKNESEKWRELSQLSEETA
jgi:hypothetical protein